jgi:hypothetical protein
MVTNLVFTMVIIPLVVCAGGRFGPFLISLPVIALPVAGKTLRQLCFSTDVMAVAQGWVVLVALPLTGTFALALWWGFFGHGREGRTFTLWTLLPVTWMYFCLNFAFFEWPWPWLDWTFRTPSALIFVFCAGILSAGALLVRPLQSNRSLS